LRKLKLKITSVTDVSKALNKLRNDCVSFGISNAEQRNLIEEVESVAIDLARRGQELSSIGSRFQVKRVIESEICQVALDVDFGGERPTLVGKLRSMFSKS